MNLTVALIGEQPLPNLLPLYQYQPEAALLVATSRTRKLAERLQTLLQTRNMQVYILETAPYDVPRIQQAIKERLADADLCTYTPTFNLTGGTKPMTFAAYAIAQQRAAPVYYLQSEGRRSLIYHYTWQKGNLQAAAPTPKEEVTIQVPLHDMLNAHLDSWSEEGAGRAEGADFERALAHALRADGRFHDVMVGIKALGGQVDIDVMVRIGNQFGIIEAKLGKAGRSLKGIQQLNTARRMLGTYTAPFYVITVSPEEAQGEIIAVTGVTPVSLPSYASGVILSPTDQVKLVDTLYNGLS